MKKLYCENCNVMRVGNADNISPEKDCQNVAERPCPVCGCPYVQEVKQNDN